MHIDTQSVFVEKPLVNINETELDRSCQALFHTETPLPSDCTYIPQFESPNGGYFTPIISILLVALLMGLIVLMVFEAKWYFYILWLVLTIVPQFFLWPRYLAHLEKEAAQLELERYGMFLLPHVMLIREPFRRPKCTALPRTMVYDAQIIRRRQDNGGLDSLMQIRYQDAYGKEQSYETLWIPQDTERVMAIIAHWIENNEVSTEK